MLIAGTVGSTCKTPNTIPSSRVAAFFSPYLPGNQQISSSPVFLFPCGEVVIQKSLQTARKRLCGRRTVKVVIPRWGQKLAGHLKGGAFFFLSVLRFMSIFCQMLNISFSFFFFLSCRRALGWSEQMLPQRFSLSSTPTYHLLHQSPSTPISSASLTSDPRSSPSICCTELRQCSSWRNNSPRAYVINAALTIAKLYLFMYLHGRISPTVGVYKKATGSPQTAPTNRAPYFSNLLPRCQHGEVINK